MQGAEFTQNLGQPPHLATVRRLTGRTTTPVLLHDGQPIVGSARIIEWLDARYAAPALLHRFAEHPGAPWVRAIYARHRAATTDFDRPSAAPRVHP